MKSRYIEVSCDVLILGSGVAGMFTALNIEDSQKVLVISKDHYYENNTNLAQGGIAACVSDEDQFECHYEDTLKAGAYYNKAENTKILIEEAPKSIYKLLDYGTKFDQDENGDLKVTREGGHRRRRILHAKDATGREVIRSLGEEIKKRKNIVLEENVFAIDLITRKGKTCGVMAINKDGEKIVYKSKAVVLATGGIGQIYRNTTNPSVATGDGIAIAHRAGAIIMDMEFVQFHPTAMYSKEFGQKFLISEAVRGEGAILRNIYGEAFMKKYHEMGDLAPRDIVARSIFIEKKKTNSPYVYLDITHKTSDFIKNRFPTIYKRCLEEEIDMTKEYIPVSPVQHYIMGGIYTDKDGKTNIEGLYACGECACTGVHGANRLASNSVLEGVVFGNRVANSINCYVKNVKMKDEYFVFKEQGSSNIDFYKLKEEINMIMDEYASIVRNEEGLKYALNKIEAIQKKLMNHGDCIGYYECVNICTVSKIIIKSALNRKESLGAHFRDDYLEGLGCIINF